MNEMPPARDTEAVAVEGGASGAAATFDGNFTGDLESWLFANSSWTDQAFPSLLDQLSWYTAHGHLAWCLFPPFGFRFETALEP